MERKQSAPDLSIRDRSIAFLVFGFLWAAYLLVYTGVIQSSDGLAMFATTESIVRRGDADISQLLWMGLQQGSLGADGRLYSRKGPGLTLLALLPVWLARRWRALGLVQTALLLNPLLTAWTGALLYRASIRLGWSRFVAMMTALAYGLATLAWPYTQTFFSDPVAAWGLFGGLYGILSYQQSRRKRYLFLAGTAWGWAYLARAVNLVTLPIYVLALAAVLEDWRWEIGDWWTQRRLPISIRFPIVHTLRPWIAFGLPIFLSGLLSLWWNWLRFGHPLETGYLAGESFSGDWLFGMGGLLLGPARGLLWYSPIILLALPGSRWFWQRARWVFGVVVSIAVVYVLLYGKWYMWHGGYSWGPRFLVPVLPFVMLLTAPAWHDLFVENHQDIGGRMAAAFLLIASLAVQWLGMLVPFRLVQDWLAAEVTPLFAPETFTRLAYSPLLRQWDFLTRENIQFAWWRAGGNSPDWLIFGLILGALLAGAILIARLVQNEGTERNATWFYGLALLLVTLVLLVRVQTPLSGARVHALAQRIAALEEPGDAVLHLRPLETQQFANAYHGRLAVYGLFPATNLSTADGALLDRLQSRYRRLWVVPDFNPPDRSGWERTLRGRTFLLLDESLPPDDRRLALYAFPEAQPLTETGVGIAFGAPPWVRLNGYGFTDRTRPGGELLVALEWESLAPADKNYSVFVHLLNEDGEKLAQRDGQPVLWTRPTTTWQPGEKIVDRHAMLLPEDLPPGTYRIAIGLYDPDSGQRQPISAGPEDDAIELGPIVVGRN